MENKQAYKYDHYFRNGFQVNGQPPIPDGGYWNSQPSGFDNNGGHFPFAYFSESNFYGDNELHKNNTIENFSQMNTCLQSETQAYGENYVKQISSHIMEDDQNAVYFFGYGGVGFKDFYFLPVTNLSSRTYSLRMNPSNICAHTACHGVGVLLASKVDDAGKLQGHLLYYCFKQGRDSGTVHLLDLNGIQASELNSAFRNPNAANRYLDQDYDPQFLLKRKNRSNQIGSFELSKPNSMIEVEVELKNGQLSVIHSFVDANDQIYFTEILAFQKPVSAQGTGIGALVDYADHNDDLLSHAVFSPLIENTTLKVFFDANGGQVLANPQVISNIAPGGTVGALPVPPQRLGYSFAGWYLNKEGTGAAFTASTAVSSTAVVYAKWTKIAASVTFRAGSYGALKDKSGARVMSIVDNTALFGGRLPSPPETDPNANYMFSYWKHANGTIVDFDLDKITAASTVVTAIFDKDENKDGISDGLQNRYVVTFNTQTGGRLTGTTSYTLLGGSLSDNAPLTWKDCITTGTVTATSTNASIYVFDGWLDSNGNRYTDLDDLKARIRVTGNMTVTAVFDRIYTFSITFNNQAGGTLSGTKSFSVTGRNPVVVGNAANFAVPTPVPNSGYLFAGWMYNGQLIDAADIPSLVITANAVFTAQFSVDVNKDGIPDTLQNRYVVTFNTQTGGQLSGTTSYTLLGGLKDDGVALTWGDCITTGTVSAASTNASIYVFDGWLDSNGNRYTDLDDLKARIRVTGNMTVTAVMDRVYTFSITFNNQVGGTLSGTKSFSVTGRNPVVVGNAANFAVPTPVASSGYLFAGWLFNGQPISVADIPKQVITANAVFTAQFSADVNNDGILDSTQRRCVINVVAQGGGKVSGVTSFTLLGGSPTYIKALKWEDCITPGEPIATASSGYQLTYWTLSSGGYFRTFEELKSWVRTYEETLTITAIFERVYTYTVTFSPQTGGRVIGKNTFSVTGIKPLYIRDAVPYMETPSAEANDGYVFTGWLYNGERADENVYRHKELTGNVTIVARFEVDTNDDNIPDANQHRYTIKFNTQTGGSLTGVTTYTLLGGHVSDDVPLNWWKHCITSGEPIATPTNASMYRFDGWLDSNGVLYSSFTNLKNKMRPTQDMTVTAQFTRVYTNTVTFNNQTGGTLRGTKSFSVTDVNPVIVGNAANFAVPTPVPNSGYLFAGWLHNGQLIDAADIPRLTITANAVFTAQFSVDANKDGIPDALQNRYVVTFNTQTGGRLTGNTSYTLLGGLTDDGAALTWDDCITAGTPIATSTNVNTYVFDGWLDSNGNKYTDFNDLKARIQVTGNMTVTAVVDRIYTFTVVFKYQRGGALSGPTTFTVKGRNPILAGSAINFAVPTPVPSANFIFTGWHLGSQLIDAADIANVVITENTIFTAWFNPDLNGDGVADKGQNKFNVSFALNNAYYGRLTNGAAINVITSNDSVRLGDPYAVAGGFIEPTVTPNQEYMFRGWEDEHGNTVLDLKQAVIDKDTKFTAIIEYDPWAYYGEQEVIFQDHNGNQIGNTIVVPWNSIIPAEIVAEMGTTAAEIIRSVSPINPKDGMPNLEFAGWGINGDTLTTYTALKLTSYKVQTKVVLKAKVSMRRR